MGGSGKDSERASREFPKSYLFELIEQCPERSIDKKLLFMEEKLISTMKCPTEHYKTVKHQLSCFNAHFKRRWVASQCHKDRFIKENKSWLSSTINLSTPASTAGRPLKEFAESSERSKRRKTQELRENVPVQELSYATQMSQRAAGNTVVSSIIKDITESPSKAIDFKNAITAVQSNDVRKHSAEQALAIFVEANLSKNQYNVIHSANKNIYPCYSLLKNAKRNCYPPEEEFLITDTCAEVKLQPLLDHTVSRLCKYLDEVIINLPDDEKQNLELLSKWGCDGSQQVQYNQKFENMSDNDSHIFLSSFVPLRLISNVNGQKKIVWQNPVPSSPRFCRPIRVRFVHETNDVTNEEIAYIENQANCLAKTEILISTGHLAKIAHTLFPTMVDGKVCNAATGTNSTMRCYICGETSKDFNNLTKTKAANPETYKFGLSILHARIRFFELILHISYKLPIKRWQARTEADKLIVSQNKLKIQQAFKTEMGLLVDIPKAGVGNTNDGNTSRTFFSDTNKASQITGVDATLIHRFKVILETISSGFSIDTEKFAAYAMETAQLYVNLYGWHPMSPTLHKILIHGAEVIKHALLPIGQLSEEAAEARNKHFRDYRLNFARKFSRQQCNRDIINRLLLSSDPLLSSSRPKPKKTSKPFSTEALQLLVPDQPNVEPEGYNEQSNANSDEDEIDSDS